LAQHPDHFVLSDPGGNIALAEKYGQKLAKFLPQHRDQFVVSAAKDISLAYQPAPKAAGSSRAVKSTEVSAPDAVINIPLDIRTDDGSDLKISLLWIKSLGASSFRTLSSLSLRQTTFKMFGLSLTDHDVVHILQQYPKQFVTSGSGTLRVIAYWDRSLFPTRLLAQVHAKQLITNPEQLNEDADRLETLLIEESDDGELPLTYTEERFPQLYTNTLSISTIVEGYRGRFAILSRLVMLKARAKLFRATNLSQFLVSCGNSVSAPSSSTLSSSSSSSLGVASKPSKLSDKDFLVKYLRLCGGVTHRRIAGPFKIQTGRTLELKFLRQYPDQFEINYNASGTALRVSLRQTAATSLSDQFSSREPPAAETTAVSSSSLSSISDLDFLTKYLQISGQVSLLEIGLPFEARFGRPLEMAYLRQYPDRFLITPSRRISLIPFSKLTTGLPRVTAKLQISSVSSSVMTNKELRNSLETIHSQSSSAVDFLTKCLTIHCPISTSILGSFFKSKFRQHLSKFLKEYPDSFHLTQVNQEFILSLASSSITTSGTVLPVVLAASPPATAKDENDLDWIVNYLTMSGGTAPMNEIGSAFKAATNRPIRSFVKQHCNRFVITGKGNGRRLSLAVAPTPTASPTIQISSSRLPIAMATPIDVKLVPPLNDEKKAKKEAKTATCIQSLLSSADVHNMGLTNWMNESKLEGDVDEVAEENNVLSNITDDANEEVFNDKNDDAVGRNAVLESKDERPRRSI
jgi:hypothetical protein